ncbi:diguanylate cyclase [Marinomonas sp.]
MPLSRLTDKADINLSDSKILVVDDKPINIQTIYSILSSDYTILAATSGEEALQVCQDNKPDLILLDVLMPNMSGLELCKRLKEDELTQTIPVIFVTFFNQQEEEDECWRCGGIDFITKPVRPMTLKNRVKFHLTLQKQKDMLQKLVFIDGLTGIYNRRYFDDHMENLKNKTLRTNNDTAILMIDIDEFKLFNDNYGHIKGDAALKTVTASLKSSLLRPSDYVCRYGGEEFIVVLPDTNIEGAKEVAERIRTDVFKLKLEHEHAKHKCITVSVGIASIIDSHEKNANPTEIADNKLYEAKKLGRNRIVF